MIRRAAVCAVLLAAVACAHRPCPPGDPVVIKVPIPAEARQLPLPDPPTYRTAGREPSTWRDYVGDLVHDLLVAVKDNATLRAIITAHNDAARQPPPD